MLSDRSLCALDFASWFGGPPADGSSAVDGLGDDAGHLGGDVEAREAVHAAVSSLQADLAVALGRPTLAAPELAHEVPHRPSGATLASLPLLLHRVLPKG